VERATPEAISDNLLIGVEFFITYQVQIQFISTVKEKYLRTCSALQNNSWPNPKSRHCNLKSQAVLCVFLVKVKSFFGEIWSKKMAKNRLKSLKIENFSTSTQTASPCSGTHRQS
jgi:hypothetical protein